MYNGKRIFETSIISLSNKSTLFHISLPRNNTRITAQSALLNPITDVTRKRYTNSVKRTHPSNVKREEGKKVNK